MLGPCRGSQRLLRGLKGLTAALSPLPVSLVISLVVSSWSPAVSYLLVYPILSQLGGAEGDPLQIRPFEAGGGE